MSDDEDDKAHFSRKANYIRYIIYKPQIFRPSKMKNQSDFIKRGEYKKKENTILSNNVKQIKQHLEKKEETKKSKEEPKPELKEEPKPENKEIIKPNKFEYMSAEDIKSMTNDEVKNFVEFKTKQMKTNDNPTESEKVFIIIDEVNKYLNSGRKSMFKTQEQNETFESLVNAIRGYDYYPTPIKYSQIIFNDIMEWYGNEFKDIIVLDIACGLLSLSKYFIINNIKTYLLEFNPYFYNIISPLSTLKNVEMKRDNFFELPEDYYFKKDINVIVMNPPFSGTIDDKKTDKIYLYFIIKAMDILINSRINKYNNYSRFLYVICPKTFFNHNPTGHRKVQEGEFIELNIPQTVIKHASKLFNIDYLDDY